MVYSERGKVVGKTVVVLSKNAAFSDKNQSLSLKEDHHHSLKFKIIESIPENDQLFSLTIDD